jgi:hypothetical protein
MYQPEPSRWSDAVAAQRRAEETRERERREAAASFARKEKERREIEASIDAWWREKEEEEKSAREAAQHEEYLAFLARQREDAINSPMGDNWQQFFKPGCGGPACNCHEMGPCG